MVFAIINPQVVIWTNHQKVLTTAAASDSGVESDILQPIVLAHIRHTFLTLTFKANIFKCT